MSDVLASGVLQSPSLTQTFPPGPYGCIGKELAKMEMRTVVPLLISRFDVRLAPGEDGSRLLYKSRDAFTMRLEELRVVFEERKRS